jgi:divalent metal cation (Fe/Co/Zn/Cd) transporter
LILSRIFLKIVKQTSAELMNNEKMRDEVCKRQIENLITHDINTNDIHSILAVTDPNQFHIQIQLLHSEVAPNESSKEYYENCAPWKSEEFIESKSDYL